MEPVNLPRSGGVNVDDTVIISGWGSTSPNGKVMPNALQKVYVPVIDLKKCIIAMQGMLGPVDIDASNVCTGPLQGGESPCLVRFFILHLAVHHNFNVFFFIICRLMVVVQ